MLELATFVLRLLLAWRTTNRIVEKLDMDYETKPPARGLQCYVVPNLKVIKSYHGDSNT